MTQLSIFELMGAAVEAIVTPERPNVDETPRVAGHDTIDDLAAILSTIPDVSPARGTSRQNRRLPVAYLYACPLLIEDKTEALRVIQRHCVIAREQIEDAPMFYEVGEWLRINGESYVGAGEARAVTKRPSTREPDGFYSYRIDPRWGNVPKPAEDIAARHWERLHAAAESCGCKLGRGHRMRTSSCDVCFGDGIWNGRRCTFCRRKPATIFAKSLPQLVLVSHWSPMLAAGVGLALAGIEPLSDNWSATLDEASIYGQPWAESLQVLSRRPRHDVLVRGLQWIYDNARIIPRTP